MWDVKVYSEKAAWTFSVYRNGSVILIRWSSEPERIVVPASFQQMELTHPLCTVSGGLRGFIRLIMSKLSVMQREGIRIMIMKWLMHFRFTFNSIKCHCHYLLPGSKCGFCHYCWNWRYQHWEPGRGIPSLVSAYGTSWSLRVLLYK